MDPAELIDSRPNDALLAFWRNRIELSVHHDGASFDFPIAADSSLFVIPAPWFVYTTYVRL
jgi:hypothetical protein